MSTIDNSGGLVSRFTQAIGLGSTQGPEAPGFEQLIDAPTTAALPPGGPTISPSAAADKPTETQKSLLSKAGSLLKEGLKIAGLSAGKVAMGSGMFLGAALFHGSMSMVKLFSSEGPKQPQENAGQKTAKEPATNAGLQATFRQDMKFCAHIFGQISKPLNSSVFNRNSYDQFNASQTSKGKEEEMATAENKAIDTTLQLAKVLSKLVEIEDRIKSLNGEKAFLAAKINIGMNLDAIDQQRYDVDIGSEIKELEQQQTQLLGEQEKLVSQADHSLGRVQSLRSERKN